MAYKTFEEIVEFDKALKKEEGCYYIYTCPSIPFGIEFRFYENDDIFVRTWLRSENRWVFCKGASTQIPIIAVLDKKWEGFKLCYEKGN